MEAAYSSEKLVTIYQTVPQHISEDGELHVPCNHIISHIHINKYNHNLFSSNLANVLEYVQTEEGENFSWYGESASVP
jgi:hypothetical protein